MNPHQRDMFGALMLANVLDKDLVQEANETNNLIKMISIIEKFTFSATLKSQSRSLLLKMDIIPQMSCLLDNFLVCNQIRVKSLIIKVF